jgi:hypothetical protein
MGGYNRTTIIEWLKQGEKLGWCDYNAKLVNKKVLFKKGNIPNNIKSVEVFKDGISKGIYPSGAYLSKNSEELFGVKFDYRSISAVCHNKFNTHKGYNFKFSFN